MFKRAPIAIGVAFSALVSTATADQVCNDAVLATTPSSRFSDHGDGTVTDLVTGLMWKRCAEGLEGAGCAGGDLEAFTWQQALSRAVGALFAQYADWRLPNKNELASLIERRCYGPAINDHVFPNTDGWYWSSSPAAYSSGYAWGVDLNDGRVYSRFKGYAGFVRLVRGRE